MGREDAIVMKGGLEEQLNQQGWPTTLVDPGEEHPSIYVLMGRILAELPPIGKTSRNTEQNFNFRGIDAILDELNALLGKNGVFPLPRVLERISDKRTTGRGSTMYEVNLHVEFTFYGPRGDSVVATAWGEGTDMGDKSTNKAHTNAFKNALVAAFAISTGEPDPDSHGVQETYAQPPRPAPQDLGWASPEEAKEAHRLVSLRVGALPEDVGKKFWQWMRDRGIPWPCTPDQLGVAETELVEQEAYVEAERAAGEEA